MGVHIKLPLLMSMFKRENWILIVKKLLFSVVYLIQRTRLWEYK